MRDGSWYMRSMPRLVVYEPGGVTSAIAVDDVLEIGRDAASGLVLGDAKASRHHATIRRDGDGWIVCDAESRHGTFLNGERIVHHVLRDGDQLQIGATRMVFEQVEDRADVALHLETSAMGSDERLRVFYQLAEATAAIDEPEAALRRALAAIVAVLGCERGVIALGSTAQTLRRAAEVQARELVIGRVVIDAVMGKGESLLLGGMELAASTLDRQGVRSAMAAPLQLGERRLGLVYVDDRGRADMFRREDLELLVAVARLAGVIVDVSARYERAVALVEVARAEAGRGSPELIGRSEQIEQVRTEVARFGATELPIHLTGESGVGKELVARALHEASPRSGASFVAVNCAAMPDTLLESELFGHIRGAFTGADKARRGKLALADHGTLFLDEVVDLSPAAQAKLLRVLEDGEVTPVGAESSIRVDVRIVSASHKDLRAAVAAETFRQDLYYRIAGAEIAIPPLRDRGADVLELAHVFIGRIRERRPAPVRLSPGAAAALAAYPWPGNVRELRHAIERACAIASGDVIEEADLSLRAPPGIPGRTAGTLAAQYAALDATERGLVEEAMARAHGNVSEAARLLGITRVMMKRRLDRLEAQRDD